MLSPACLAAALYLCWHAASWTMLMSVWCSCKWMQPALTNYQQPISYYFKAGVWAEPAEGLRSSVWFRRSTQTAQSQLPGLARIWAKAAKISTDTPKKKDRKREKERRASGEIRERNLGGHFNTFLQFISPASPLLCLPLNARRYRQTSTEQFYLNNSCLLYIY